MATFTKFNTAVLDIGTNSAARRIDLNADTFYAALIVPGAPTPPVAADNVMDTTTTPCTVKATSNVQEIAAGNGYTKKGIALAAVTYTQSGGVGKMVSGGADPVWTAGPAAMASFRYIVLYDDTSGAAAGRALIGFYDYTSTVTLNVGETFTLDLDGTNGILTIT